jgi:probable HAF family extracellular repeat protein
MSTHERRLRLVSTRIAAVAVLAVTLLAAASSAAAASPAPNLRYRVVDLGTLGGPNSAETVEFPYVNNAGLVVGFADTATPNPDNEEGFVFHAFSWRGGPMHDLGTLGGTNSFAIWSNTAGTVVGLSETGRTDPMLGVPEGHATLWRHGQVVDLGTLGGHESLAAFINERGQVVGVAADTVPDQFSLFGWGTRTRAFLWQHGVMRDLGTLGGPDADPSGGVNERGQVAGTSYTSSTPNADTGTPPLHPFLWDKGRMVDLGTLGGTFGFATALNNRGEVVGQSSLPGDVAVHPFRWRAGRMQDLGTLGGSFGRPTWMNNAGAIVGGAFTTGNEAFHAFYWRKGRMTDLGTVDGDTCSLANFVNARGLVVGTSGDCGGLFEKHGFVSVRGGRMIDLNEFLPPGSHLTITDGETINDSGMIAASGMLPNGDFHAVVLVPCTGGPGCRTATSDSRPATAAPGMRGSHPWTPSELAATVSGYHRMLSASRHTVPGLPTGLR